MNQTSGQPGAVGTVAPTAPRRIDWLTIAQFALSALGFLGSLAGAGLLLALGFGGVFGETIDLASSTLILHLGWVSGVAALLSLPSVITSFLRLLGQTPRLPDVHGFRLASIGLLLWPLVLAVGLRVPAGSRLAPWLLSPLLILAIGLPIWWLVELALRRLNHGSAQRGWGIWTASMYVTMPVVLITELVVFGLIGLLVVSWVSQRPELVSRMEDFLQQLMWTASGDPEAVLEAMRPFLQNPLVIGGILGMTSLIVPLMEEALKPLAMLAIWGRPTPAQGFTAGALCGGAFALLESLLSIAGPANNEWTALAVGRAGTALLHITCTALVGWGLATAWRGQGGKLAAAYLIAALFHGVWNAFSVFTGLGFLARDLPEGIQFLERPILAAPLILAALVGILFALLVGGNRLLRKESAAR